MTTPASLYDGTFERTDDGGVIRFERRLPFAIRDVWEAITDPARLNEWWLPFDADITVDLREGGTIVMSSRGNQGVTITCDILRVEAPMLLEYTHAQPGSYLRWDLEPVDDGCVPRLSHYVSNPDAAIGDCYLVGLHTSLSRLEPCLSGEPAAWDWGEFAAAQKRYATMGYAPDPDAT